MEKKYKILFVCLGNICRSPSAEAVMKKLVKDAGMEDRFLTCYPPGISVGFYFPSGPDTRFL